MKRQFVKFTGLLLCLSILLMGCGNNQGSSDSDGIKIGVLFSLSGATAVSEKAMSNGALLAIEEINEKGGVNGKKLIPVVEDQASDPAVAATKAKKLLMQDKVAAIIGGYTSSSRQAMLPIMEQNNGLLVYPCLYEGGEYSRNIIYAGPTPNQQLEPYIPWLVKNVGKKFYFIGSDHVWPVETNKVVTKLLEMYGGEVVGEQYVPIGHTEFASVINNIKEAAPDVIFATVVGDSTPAFYKQYKSYGLDAKKMPIASLATFETEVAAMGIDVAQGHITSGSYFQSIDTPENKKFVEAYRKKYGADEAVTMVVESSYYSTYLLAEALGKIKDISKTDDLIKAFAGLEIQAPEGKIKVDSENNHTWLFSRIGKVGADGQFEIIQSSNEPIHPEPWSKLLYPDHEEPWKNK